MVVHFIFYVRDQQLSAHLYSKALGLDPSLNVPGMTEFQLQDGCILGLMPERGIKALLGGRIVDPGHARDVPRAELYLRVDNPEIYHKRALENGARELSPILLRDWGDYAGYCADLDGHVIAFAKHRSDCIP